MPPRTTKARTKSSKPHSRSATSRPCTCENLEHATDEPDCPVKFDPELNEYNIVSGRGSWRIYHCYFCGGAAPESKRGSLFATIPNEERERLGSLTTGFTSFDEVIARFGAPDEDMAAGHGDLTHATDERGPTYTTYRTLRYRGLSKVAVVEFIDYGPKHGVRSTLQGKYIGPPKPSGS